ncbi:von Willebrand factor type A domain-containing protein [Phytohabitans sp. ZYX-F-186]|uniref:von Willebrand factor type A domain-containing protein n=1 Tax=Phytohabitans maris TaxID=3071409 RepID=A0ABU0ZCG1_9ACTN|nr:von Willebrand factor type A domain-containing protein [Phytohabitans sp. ZYX-F-186]MDQ7904119.1 von Willebrand factor type A domain-containing protein [Phytohabitans sp. ZYX-F-186]
MVRFRRYALVVGLAAVLGTPACGSGGGGSSSDAGAREPLPDRPRPATEGRERGDETAAEDDPQSTFALDVDTASYGYARRLITDGRRPEADLIRPEEFVNAFDQDYPEPSGDGFAVRLDGARLPEFHEAGPDSRLMRVGLRTRGEDAETRPDAALTFVVDVSGSMGEPGRLDLVQDSLHTLVDALRPTDSVAIVAFSGEAEVVTGMTPVADARALHEAVDALRTRSSTNLEAGLVLGYRVAREGFRPGRTNRVIVLSDGLANTGDTDADGILERVSEEAGKQIALLGVGVGSEYGDALMERLADRGDGFVVYVGEREQARDVFVHRLPATLAVRALDAKVQVTFDPAVVRSYRLIGYENRAVADEDFRDDRVDGGEVGPGHSVTALYEVRLTGEAPGDARAAQVRARWLDPVSRDAAEAYESLTVADLGGRFDAAGPRLRMCYAAGFFAEALRGAGAVPLDSLAAVAGRAAGETGDPAVRDLTALIDRAADLD